MIDVNQNIILFLEFYLILTTHYTAACASLWPRMSILFFSVSRHRDTYTCIFNAITIKCLIYKFRLKNNDNSFLILKCCVCNSLFPLYFYFAFLYFRIFVFLDFCILLFFNFVFITLGPGGDHATFCGAQGGGVAR